MAQPDPANAWHVHLRRLDSGIHEATAYLGPEHDDGELAEADPAELDGRPFLWRTVEADRALIRIEVAESALRGAAPLWFVHVDEPKASPAATNLVAFPTDHLPAGTVVDRYRFATMGVHNDQQAGAVRWYPGTGAVHQIFVAEPWRRKGTATRLLYTASAFHHANGWPGRLHGDGRRTELGERLVASLHHPHRVAPLTEQMPPMDPS